MEKTATRIIAAAQRNLERREEETETSQIVTPPPPPPPQRLPPAPSTRRNRGKTPRSRRAAASPRFQMGGSASKRIISHSKVPQRHGFPHASPILPTNRRNSESQGAPTNTVPRDQRPQQSDANSSNSQQGFHTLPPRLP